MGSTEGKCRIFNKYLSVGRNALINIGGGVLAYVFFVNGMEPFRLTGAIKKGFPTFSLPPFSIEGANGTTVGLKDMLADLGTAPISIALITILEGVTVATIFCEKNGVVDATQEMIAIGASNILGETKPIVADWLV